MLAGERPAPRDCRAHEGGLISEEEIARHAQSVLQELGEIGRTRPSALPRASQVIDLPESRTRRSRWSSRDRQTERLARATSYSIMLAWGVRQAPEPFWLTLCREARSSVKLTAAACPMPISVKSPHCQRLIAAGRPPPGADHAVLVDFGAAGTRGHPGGGTSGLYDDLPGWRRHADRSHRQAEGVLVRGRGRSETRRQSRGHADERVRSPPPDQLAAGAQRRADRMDRDTRIWVCRRVICRSAFGAPPRNRAWSST